MSRPAKRRSFEVLPEREGVAISEKKLFRPQGEEGCRSAAGASAAAALGRTPPRRAELPLKPAPAPQPIGQRLDAFDVDGARLKPMFGLEGPITISASAG